MDKEQGVFEAANGAVELIDDEGELTEQMDGSFFSARGDRWRAVQATAKRLREAFDERALDDFIATLSELVDAYAVARCVGGEPAEADRILEQITESVRRFVRQAKGAKA